ncbi:MAG: monovalent cation/H+ antiporter complex subunit F [Coriobacteriia bacterium]|nr:monovalent cation/H+ antiporter complex subunit F [Coriobacteriia bacterium]
MTLALEILATFIMITVALGIYRIERGPTGTDRMLSAMLFGTSGVALTLVLAELTDLHGLRDMALVFALLGALTAVAFVKRAWGADD